MGTETFKKEGVGINRAKAEKKANKKDWPSFFTVLIITRRQFMDLLVYDLFPSSECKS